MELTPIRSNCTELKLNDYVVLFSYKTPVAYVDRKTGNAYQTNKKWSTTTSRHINRWFKDIGYVTKLPQLVNQEVLDSLIK